MGTDLRAEAVLEWGDDAAPVRVVLGVGAGHQVQVQRKPQCVAAHLDVALLEHVEQRDLDPLGEVGQFVDAEDAAVGTGDEAVVHRLGVAERAPLRDLDRVDVTDEVAHAGVGCRQLLAVALAAVLPRHLRPVPLRGDDPPASRAYRVVGMVVDLAAGDDRRPLVQQCHQRADQSGLALAALAEQHHVVAGQDRPFHLREHGVVEADDPREAHLAPGEAAH